MKLLHAEITETTLAIADLGEWCAQHPDLEVLALHMHRADIEILRSRIPATPSAPRPFLGGINVFASRSVARGEMRIEAQPRVRIEALEDVLSALKKLEVG